MTAMSFQGTTSFTKAALPGRPSGQHYIPAADLVEDGYATTTTFQTISAEPQSLYNLWSNVSLFPRWQEHVVSVTETGTDMTHWVMGNPEDKDGKRIEFDSKRTENIPGKKLAWQSMTEDVKQKGSVTFTPSASGRGTLVTLIETVKVPGGVIGNAVAGLAKRSPHQTVIENLRHFKELAETGEIPSVAGQPHGPRGIVGGVKEWMYGETNPTPPGTSDQT